MQYFILAPGDDEQSAYYDTNLLGEDNGFGVFWAGQGLKTLMRVVETDPEKLEVLTIKSDKGETLTVGEFLERIEKLKVRIN